MCFVLLFLLGLTANATDLSGLGDKTILNLNCTNNFDERMSCQLERPNCTEYNLTLRDSSNHEKKCILLQCGIGRCCCSVRTSLIPQDTYTAILKGGESMESKSISVTHSVKPVTPTIISVKESNGDFEVMWKTNMKGFINDDLEAQVIYYPKGGTEEVSGLLKPPKVNGLNYFKIPARKLKPSTTYLVRVRSFLNWSGMFSERSKEGGFKTYASPNSTLLAIIVSLSITAVILSSAIYACYVKFKTKWWDSVAKYPNPKLLIMHASKQELLKPVPAIISSVCVESLIPDNSKPWSKMSLTDTSSGSLQQSSGISTGSSHLSYASAEPADIKDSVQDALSKAFPNILPISPSTTCPFVESSKISGLLSTPLDPCGVRADDMSFRSFGFDNKTYSILVPSCPHQIMTDSCEVQMQAEMPCDSAYHPCKNDTVNFPDQQVPGCMVPAQQDLTVPLVVSYPMTTDMSYQQHNADSGRFSHAEDPSLSSISSGTNTTTSCDVVSRVEAGCESSDEAVNGAPKRNGKSEEAIVCDGCVPAGLHSFLAVDDDYQAFQSLVGQPDVLLSEQRSDEYKEHLDSFQQESFIKIPQSFLRPVVVSQMNDGQSGQCLSALQTPFLSLMSPGQSMPVITDSGYQSV